MSAGPLVSALSGVPAGRLVDRRGAGLAALALGAALLAAAPISLGLAGYIAPIVLLTAGYVMFQAAKNTAIMGAIDAGQRGLVAGMLNLSRNLGLVTGASLMGAVFAFGAGAPDLSTAAPAAVARSGLADIPGARGIDMVGDQEHPCSSQGR